MSIAEILDVYQLTAEEVASDLRTATAVLRARGRTIGVFQERPGGRVCLVGAIRIAVTGNVDPYPHHPMLHRVEAAQDVLVIELDLADQYELYTWNDNLCTSDARAAEVLERAAARVEAEAGLSVAA